MEYKIGEVFELDGVKLKVEREVLGCDGCYFSVDNCLNVERDSCTDLFRTDAQNIIFTEVKE